jgi:hypothetical protein
MGEREHKERQKINAKRNFERKEGSKSRMRKIKRE